MIAVVSVFPQNALSYSVLSTKVNFAATKNAKTQSRNSHRARNQLFMASQEVNDAGSDTAPIVDKLLDLVEHKQEVTENLEENPIPDLMSKLSSNAQNYVLDESCPSSLFDPLVGYYNVSYTLTSRPNDNPVGGKWTRGLWTIKRTMQHVLPPLPLTTDSSTIASRAVAQVVNAIRLELLWGFVGVWVLLRGDAVPLKLDPTSSDTSTEDSSNKSKKSPPKLLPNLSDRTVKAYFDRPLIGVSLRRRRNQNSKPFLKRVLTLGPTSAVVLDTPYADSRIRLGKGGTSGSQFVFSRLPETDQEAREGWKWLLEDGKHKVGNNSLTKTGLVVRLGTLGLVFGVVSRVLQQRWIKVLAGAYGVISGISILGLLRSTGGIETEGDTYMEGNQ